MRASEFPACRARGPAVSWFGGARHMHSMRIGIPLFGFLTVLSAACGSPGTGATATDGDATTEGLTGVLTTSGATVGTTASVTTGNLSEGSGSTTQGQTTGTPTSTGAATASSG